MYPCKQPENSRFQTFPWFETNPEQLNQKGPALWKQDPLFKWLPVVHKYRTLTRIQTM